METVSPSNVSSKTSEANLTINTKIDIGEIIKDVGEEIKDSTPEKPWWTSKVILINLGVLIAAGASYFGLDLNSKGIDVKGIIEVLSIILPMVNIYLRSRANGKTQPIKNVVPTVVTNTVVKPITAMCVRLMRK